MMQISVIIPAYKPEVYIWECLESLYTQTLPKDRYEVIIVLNGCKDPFYTEISSWIETHKDLLIKLIQTDVAGVSNARNIGIDTAEGEYIAFIDDDDFVSPDYLNELLVCAQINIVPLCYPLQFEDGGTDYQPYRITETYERLHPMKKVTDFQARRYFSGPVYKLIHHSIIGTRRYDTRLKVGEDTLFMFLISDRIKGVSFTHRNAVYYRRIRKNSATTKNRNFYEHFKSNIIEMTLLTKYYLSNPFKYSFKLYFTRIGGGTVDIIKSLFS